MTDSRFEVTPRYFAGWWRGGMAFDTGPSVNVSRIIARTGRRFVPNARSVGTWSSSVHTYCRRARDLSTPNHPRVSVACILQARLRSGQRYCDSRLYTKMCSPKHQHCRHVRQCRSVPKGAQVAETDDRVERDQRRRTVPIPEYRPGNIHSLWSDFLVHINIIYIYITPCLFVYNNNNRQERARARAFEEDRPFFDCTEYSCPPRVYIFSIIPFENSRRSVKRRTGGHT